MNLHPTEFPSSPRKGPAGPQVISGVSNSVLRGCNAYFKNTVILAQIDLGGSDGDIAGRDESAECFRDLFLKLPTLIDEPVRTQNFCTRLRKLPAKISTVLLEAIVAVEHAVFAKMHRLDTVEFIELFDACEVGNVVVGWSTNSPSFSRSCSEAAIAGVNVLLLHERGLDTSGARRQYQNLIEQLLATARSRRLTTTVCVIREAAKLRGIDCAYLGTSYLRLGQGRHQLFFRASLTGKTSHTSSQLSVHKSLATRTLRAQNLPVPKQIRAGSEESVRRAAEKIGYPFIVKPMKGYGGYGVTLVSDAEDIAQAHQLATKKDGKVVVEEFIEGEYFRLLVIDHKFVAALHVARPEITGDGQLSVSDLVTELNQDPFRDGFRLVKVDLDERLAQHLAKSGLNFDSILPEGNKFALRDIANVSQGGYSIDVTDQVHHDYAAAAERAARVIGLDVCGIDVITRDIERSYKEAGGAIIELNSRPGLGMHAFPRHGKPRNVGGAILECIFRNGSRANVTPAIVLGDQRTAVVARDLDEILRMSDRSVGMAIRSQAYVNGVRSEQKDRKYTRAVRALIRDPQVDTLISTQAPAGIVRRGLQFDDVEVATIRAPAADADLHAYREALSILTKANPRRLVFGVRNDLAMCAAEPFERSKITLVSRSGLTRRVRHHLAAGGHAVIARWVDGVRHIAVYEGEKQIVSMPAIPKPEHGSEDGKREVTAINATGHRSRRIETRLYAVAMALGLGVTIEQVRTAMAHLPAITK